MWLSILILACLDGSDDSEGADSAEDSASPDCADPVPYETMVEEYPAVMCAYDATCDDPFFPDEASCRQLYAEDASEENYDVCDGRACLDALEALPPCEHDLDLPDECVGMLAGGSG